MQSSATGVNAPGLSGGCLRLLLQERDHSHSPLAQRRHGRRWASGDWGIAAWRSREREAPPGKPGASK